MRGFELWIPPVSNKYDDDLPIYEIIGHDAQFVQFPLVRVLPFLAHT